MFPFFTDNPSIQALVSGILAFIASILSQFGVDPALQDTILSLREFAGAFFPDPSTGLAMGWAIVVDDLLDLVLRILGLDPLAVRGDH